MEKISELNKKCLSNMPILLDSIKMTLDTLKEEFSDIYKKMNEFLEKQCTSTKYTVSPRDKINGNIYLFTDDYKKHHLDYMDLLAKLTYRKVIEYTYRKSYFSFSIEFGYWCDEEQNVIYFQMQEETDEQKNVLTEKIWDEIKQTIPKTWESDLYTHGICIQFDIDNTLSIEKIKECLSDFKEYVLKPVFGKLSI